MNRKRVAKFRVKMNLTNERDSPVYKSARTLGKAVSKAARSLPFSPRKKRLVVGKFAEKVGLKKSANAPSNILPAETKQIVQEFYYRDDISRQAPGKREYVTLWKENGKVQLQKRHLYYPIKEIHSLFQQEYPDVKIGKSSFAKLKTANVLHRHETPKDAYLCLFHENITLLCEAVHKAIPNFLVYSSNFVDNMVCSSDSETFMMGNCTTCKDKNSQWLCSFEGLEFNDQTFWHEWTREGEYNEMAHARRREKKGINNEISTGKKKKMQ